MSRTSQLCPHNLPAEIFHSLYIIWMLRVWFHETIHVWAITSLHNISLTSRYCYACTQWNGKKRDFGRGIRNRQPWVNNKTSTTKGKREKKGGSALENTCVWKSTLIAVTWRTSQGFSVYQKRTWAWVSDVFSTVFFFFPVAQSEALQHCLTMVWLVLSVVFNQQQWQSKEQCQKFKI